MRSVWWIDPIEAVLWWKGFGNSRALDYWSRGHRSTPSLIWETECSFMFSVSHNQVIDLQQWRWSSPVQCHITDLVLNTSLSTQLIALVLTPRLEATEKKIHKKHFLSQLLIKTGSKYLKAKSVCPTATVTTSPARRHWIVNWTLIAVIAVWLLTYSAVT